MSQTRAQFTQRRLLTLVCLASVKLNSLDGFCRHYGFVYFDDVVFPDNKRYLPRAPRRIGKSPQIVVREVKHEPQLMPRPPPVERRLLMAS